MVTPDTFSHAHIAATAATTGAICAVSGYGASLELAG